jgi:uncharacterized protein (DUF1778 family)
MGVGMTDEELKDLKKMFENPEIMYVSQEAYDKLQEMIAEPPDPAIMESVKRLMNRKTPWDETND